MSIFVHLACIYSFLSAVYAGPAANGTTVLNEKHTESVPSANAISNSLQQIHTTVQNLQEKAHTWAIFQHHFESWNEQIRALEHKFDLQKQQQTELGTHVSNKFTSLEFTLNHVLSKLIYLSDSCYTYVNAVPDGSKPISPDSMPILQPLEDLKRVQNADHKLLSEMSTRVNNILRRVQSNFSEALNTSSKNMSIPKGANNKMANLMQPVNGVCNIERNIKTLDRRISSLFANLLPRQEFKQMQSLAKKNAKILESIFGAIMDTNKRLDGDFAELRLLSVELSTFTESSDLLLKRIETIMNRLLKHTQEQHSPDADKCNENSEKSGDEKDTVDPVDQTKGTGTDVVDNKDDSEELLPPTNKSKAKGETENNEFPVKIDEKEPNQQEIEFVQPSKSDCHEILSPRIDGIYRFGTPELNEYDRDFNERFCVFATNSSAWTIIQNRGPYTPQENFNRSWADYRNGFGSLDKDFWFGNEFIYQLSSRDDYELRVELEDFDGQQVWAEYGTFRLDGEQYKYNLLLDDYSGTVPDALLYHNELDFSTFDQRNDMSLDACCACATGYASGWWFNNCSQANLNGIYHDTPTGHNYVGIIWENWRGDYSLKKARMMIRPKASSKGNEKEKVELVSNEFLEYP